MCKKKEYAGVKEFSDWPEQKMSITETELLQTKASKLQYVIINKVSRQQKEGGRESSVGKAFSHQILVGST